MKLNIFEWYLRDDRLPVCYDESSPNPKRIYSLSIWSVTTGNWLWYVKLRYGLLIAKYQTSHIWVEQYVSSIDTNPKLTELSSKIKSARMKLSKAENKLKLAERVAKETLNFGDNEQLLNLQRAKVANLRKELDELINS